MTLEAPPPVRTPAPVKPSNGFHPPPGDGYRGNGHGGSGGKGSGGMGSGGTGWPGEGPQPEGQPPPARRRSIWPLILDLGLAMALFGLIITGRFLIVIGAVPGLSPARRAWPDEQANGVPTYRLLNRAMGFARSLSAASAVAGARRCRVGVVR